MANPPTLVLTGYGINCDDETRTAFELAGASAKIVHVNDLIKNPETLKDYRILAFPGGFSYGDDLGSGTALASKIKNHLWDEMQEFVHSDNLAIGICNGFQVMVNLGLLPALGGNYGERQSALIHNDTARYMDRWVDLELSGDSPWIIAYGLDRLISLPIAHGEGKFFADDDTLRKIVHNCQVAARYKYGPVCESQHLTPNPNGSLEQIASITDPSGRLIGMMPHPERAIAFTQLPDWQLTKEKLQRAGQPLPTEGPGLQVFRNGVNYFK
jgi:phosphoribosylformylglycinamidine synthase